MTAQKSGGRTKVVDLQVDSSIGTAQANRLSSEVLEGLSADEKKYWVGAIQK